MFIVQISVIVFACYVVGKLMEQIGQAQVIGHIAAGILLGPTFFPGIISLFSSQISLFNRESLATIDELANLGLILLMFEIGLSHFHKNNKVAPKRNIAALKIALLGMLFPFIGGMLAGNSIHAKLAPQTDCLLFSIFMGTAMAVSALPVIVRIIEDLKILHLAVIPTVITAAIFTDAIGWGILALDNVFAAVGGESDSLWSYFSVVTITLSLYWLGTCKVVVPLLVRYAHKPEMRFPAIIFWILISSWGADYIHLHNGFGALLAGSMLARIPGLAKQWHTSMNGFMHYILLPVLFVSAGLKTHFDVSMATQDIAWIIGFTLLAFITKFGGALIGARISGYSLHDATIVGALMNTRGLMELVVLSIGLELHLISQPIYSVMVIVTLLVTATTSPILRWLNKEASSTVTNKI
ncbi:Na(+)/H(+)-K(+) antiporter GerN [Carnimonas sp. R-84981]|uniref:cation:proton antiporter n=1 Tax=Carnimonas bestiolae TaxID=3402172 RepID=UPI003EDBDD02